MQTLVRRIPDDLARELDAEAKKANLTKSEVARRRLIAAGLQGHDAASGFDLIGTVEGGLADVSARKKEYLKTTDPSGRGGGESGGATAWLGAV